MKSRGFTLLETMVAMTLLILGSAALFWALRSGVSAQQRLQTRAEVWDALVSEAERLQGVPTDSLRDTTFEIPRSIGSPVHLHRVVLDSARRDSLCDPLASETFRQAWRARPKEVVLEAVVDSGVPQKLFLVLPEYQWY